MPTYERDKSALPASHLVRRARPVLPECDLRHRLRGRLYLKVKDGSKPAFEARGMGPFLLKEGQTIKPYFGVPSEAFADPESLLSWAVAAIREGQADGR